ncbi:MAG: hypothetical protein B7Z80_27135 [Rhodospirillales bacterium 20-64-7]|nr:MAG: hypothetical protein B7Z80_27135 [Rhodospirillales bacterium 20-64-7]HQT76555.1 DegT/DnrJ/EryC1/StrS family aminotransferase [Rhodopila sp.]
MTPPVTGAALGGTPAFPQLLGRGRPWLPSRARIEAALDGIIERHWYTNHGPLAQELEQRLQAMLGVRHAVCVVNGTIGLVMAAEALGLRGKVLLPATARQAAVDSLAWTGLQPVFADANPDTLLTDRGHMQAAAEQAGSGLCAMLATRPWGLHGDTAGPIALASEHAIPVWFDSSDALGSIGLDESRPGRAGACEVFSLGPGRMVTATEGGCIVTDDDELAARLRNIRSSYGAGHPVKVVRTANGRMSEFQAAVALLSLDDLPANQAHLSTLLAAYRGALAGIPGIQMRPGAAHATSGVSAIISVDEAELGLSRDDLIRCMAVENIAAGPLLQAGAWSELAGAAHIAASCIRLPVGRAMTVDDACRVGETVRRIAHAAPALRVRA